LRVRHRIDQIFDQIVGARDKFIILPSEGDNLEAGVKPAEPGNPI
jgi:hypothetical protein